jgi:hypothetical protein
MICPVQDQNGGTHVYTVCHTNHEHASTSTQIVAKHQPLFHPFSGLAEKPSPLAPMFSDNLRRGGALPEMCTATW